MPWTDLDYILAPLLSNYIISDQLLNPLSLSVLSCRMESMTAVSKVALSRNVIMCLQGPAQCSYMVLSVNFFLHPLISHSIQKFAIQRHRNH